MRPRSIRSYRHALMATCVAGTVATVLAGAAMAQTLPAAPAPPTPPPSGITQPSSGQTSSGKSASTTGQADEALTMKILEGWPEHAATAAKKVIAKYGLPNEATPTRVVWFNNGPWKRTTITPEEFDHDFPMTHKDVMLQTIDFKVPADKFDELARYDGSVVAERTKGELSAFCDKEEANFLALNLAHDLIEGKRDVEGARKFYGDTIQAFMKGEKPAYTQGFVFKVPTGNQGDRDKVTIPK